MQQGERELVDAHVVVFPVRAGCLEGAGITFLACRRAALKLHCTVAVDLVGYTEALALPLAGLLEQMLPGHLRIAARIKADAADPRADGFLDIRQQSPIVGDPR